MLSFVKPSLLGTRKEFCNRFVNPITNGQHLDSTPYDVRLMKRRAHVLHEMLAGCVQVRALPWLCSGTSFSVFTWSILATGNSFTGFFIRSTLRNRPNKVGLKCPSIRVCVLLSTKSFFDFSDIWHIGRGRSMSDD